MKVLTHIAIGIFGALAALEVLLHFLPVLHGWANPPFTAIDPIVREWPHASYTYSRRWNLLDVQTGRFNNLGFPADEVNVAKPSVAVIGNSFVEAAMVPQKDRLGAVLAKRGCLQVAALGMSGENAPGYIVTANWALKKLMVRAVVFVIIAGDIEESFTPKPRGYWYQNVDGHIVTAGNTNFTLRNTLMKSRLFDYLYYHLKVGPKMFFEDWRRPDAPFVQASPVQAAPHGDTSNHTISSLVRTAEEKFIADAAKLQRQGVIVFLALDPDRQAIYRGDSGQTPTMVTLSSLARNAGLQVIDLSATFSEAYRKDHRKFELDQSDSHWNAYGHSLAANAIGDVLRPQTCKH